MERVEATHRVVTRVLVTGGAGLLGNALVRSAPREARVEVTVRSRPSTLAVTTHRVDLSVPGAFDALVAVVEPELVIHTAYGKDDLDRDVVAATTEVVRTCATHGVRLIHCSSDVVFDGEHGPYAESDAPSPISAYGEAKAVAETTVAELVPEAAIVRTSLLIQSDPPDPTSAWVIEANRCGEAVTLFGDEFRCPVAVDDVAGGIWAIAGLSADGQAGVWHLVGPQRLSRVDLGALLAGRFGLDRSLLVDAAAATVPGPRPRDLTLTSERAEATIGWSPRSLAEVLVL